MISAEMIKNSFLRINFVVSCQGFIIHYKFAKYNDRLLHSDYGAYIRLEEKKNN